MRAKSPFPSETGAKTPIPLTIKLIIRSSTCIYELDFLTIKNGEVWSKNKSLFDSISQCIKNTWVQRFGFYVPKSMPTNPIWVSLLSH
jgi:hypothetical protein